MNLPYADVSSAMNPEAAVLWAGCPGEKGLYTAGRSVSEGLSARTDGWVAGAELEVVREQSKMRQIGSRLPVHTPQGSSSGKGYFHVFFLIWLRSITTTHSHTAACCTLARASLYSRNSTFWAVYTREV